MKSTLIFLHGGPGFQDYLEPFFNELSDHFYCVFYDQVRGPQIKIENMLSQLDDFVNSVSGKIILIGHSWGSILATEYVIKNQNKISGLVLMSTGLNHVQWKDEYHKELKNLGLNDAGPEQIFLTSSELEIGVPFLDGSWLTFSEETFDSINTSYLDKFDVTILLGSLKIPIINIFGESDVRFPARVAKTFKNFNTDIIDYEIANAGHFSFLQKAGREQIYKILKDFF